MQFIPNKDVVIPTKIEPGDLITVSARWQVSILRRIPDGMEDAGKWIPLVLLEGDGVIFSDQMYIPMAKLAYSHEVAFVFAKVIASIAGLFVEDCYEMFTQGDTIPCHQFPVTDLPPNLVVDAEG